LVLHRAKGKVSVALFSELTGQIPAAYTWHGSSPLIAMYTVIVSNVIGTVILRNLVGWLKDANSPSVLVLQDC